MAKSQNGWPTNPPITARTIPGTNIKVSVADGPAGDVLMYVAERFNQSVERLEGPVRDEWGYNDRMIAGTKVWSNHASGTAIDLNATKHPNGKRGTFTGEQVAEIREILKAVDGVVRWGGDYTRPDEMHFEINTTAANVKRVADRLRAPSNGLPRTLRKGDQGQEVRELQALLNRMYPAYSRLSVDGIFGNDTEAVVKEMQRRSYFEVDGIVGPVTWARLLGR